ncbi:unnamed protein product [Hyaloperonospora brassicae]|nr:unnamed protein product [Hyaloperonospora brassicae]
MEKKEVSMEEYKDKVILVVNVSSKCGLTPTNYPELQQLYEKYQEEGLVVLGFPCNQFKSQEPGTHEDIKEFVKQYNVTFPLFEKHDVNGSNARPVFTYLKAKLPGTFGNYIKWNFTKFLVDRNGQPYKRYAPTDLPLSFESDIKELLAKKSGPEKTEEEATEEAVDVAKSAAETTTENKEEDKKEEVTASEVVTKDQETVTSDKKEEVAAAAAVVVPDVETKEVVVVSNKTEDVVVAAVPEVVTKVEVVESGTKEDVAVVAATVSEVVEIKSEKKDDVASVPVVVTKEETVESGNVPVVATAL